VREGLAWLATRYRLVLDPRLFRSEGYLAGTDDERADALARAFRDPDVAAIVCARGGFGVTRVIDRLPWAELAKPIVGFSDITALHLEANARGVATVHGPNVTGLGRASPRDRAAFIDALEGRPLRPWRGLDVLSPGTAEGVGVGGNLALVYAMAAAGRLAVPPGAVLFLEDVNERPYAVDRMLTSLRLGGHLAHVSAVVCGTFSRGAPGPDGVTVRDVLSELAATLRCPVLAGAPFGHEADNRAFVLGCPVAVRGADVVFL